MEQNYMISFLFTILGSIFLLLAIILTLNIFLFSFFIGISIFSNVSAYLLWIKIIEEQKETPHEQKKEKEE
ncbi:hypothetical protein [Bacillus sp. NPDC094106]|uniref:hypothetical protein n=1 Tax=Bacillus sp. NPDC094106 TaxID=3363949 RepID=UPI00382E98CC